MIYPKDSSNEAYGDATLYALTTPTMISPWRAFGLRNKTRAEAMEWANMAEVPCTGASITALSPSQVWDDALYMERKEGGRNITWTKNLDDPSASYNNDGKMERWRWISWMTEATKRTITFRGSEPDLLYRRTTSL